MESVFKVGTYIVPLQNRLLSRDEPLTAYKPYMIIEDLHVPYILTDSGKCNFCAYYGKEEVERVEGIRWFATLKEAQTFCNQHIFEIGKYYSFNWDLTSEKSTVIAKVKEIGATNIIISWRNYLWIDGPSKYSKFDGYDFIQISQVRQLSLEEVQQYLEDGNPDKIFKPVAGKWYRCYYPELDTEYIIKRPEDESWECCNNIENGKYYFCGSFKGELVLKEEVPVSEIQKYLPKNHPDKVKIPEIPGRPYDVTTIPQEFILPKKWCVKASTQEEDNILINWRGGTHTDALGSSYMLSDKMWSPNNNGFKEITFEQFKKYVLKENTPVQLTENSLPEKWQIKVTPENIDMITNWRTAGELSAKGYCVNKVETCDHVGYWFPKKQENYTEITSEQFKKYVLKQENGEKDWTKATVLNVQEHRPLEPLKGEQIQAFCRDMFIPKEPKQNKEDEEFLNYLPEPD